ncbi:uncharacterized protein B0H18DRAFT_889847 [Fomitopsis serialis]|uniref:uncharacterized protein n=1 Tax=Fomitopsis serialis TaxID=139415 RepID=UPI002007FC5F|nr:uncharacterized protein B0H18DRAFT_889847 [Neoantrodia serialis]KAH9912521.1 hypothetical protein B0H18DRAFT_889847 [Neoantrodia serialis]
MDIDMHLTQLLSNLTLDGMPTACCLEKGKRRAPTDVTNGRSSRRDHQRAQPRNPSASSNCTKTADEPPPCGCALLQWLRGQLQEGQYATTGGDYLEIIFTHREAFHAFPDGHRTCAIGFSDIAMDLERREMRPDRESDPEAAAAFRHEAWVIASSGIWSQPTI